MGILIIDDTDFDRNLLRSILASAGYEIAGLANCGEEGIRQYETLSPQLVMLDLIMPDLNGIDTQANQGRAPGCKSDDVYLCWRGEYGYTCTKNGSTRVCSQTIYCRKPPECSKKDNWTSRERILGSNFRGLSFPGTGSIADYHGYGIVMAFTAVPFPCSPDIVSPT